MKINKLNIKSENWCENLEDSENRLIYTYKNGIFELENAMFIKWQKKYGGHDYEKIIIYMFYACIINYDINGIFKSKKKEKNSLSAIVINRICTLEYLDV